TTTPVPLLLEPLDTLFFRDGRPFDAANRVSGGLPYPQPLAAALRTALLARQGAGFDFGKFAHLQQREERSVGEALDLCAAPPWIVQTRFRGPWLAIKKGPREVEPLLPVPATLARAEGKRREEETEAKGAPPPGRWVRANPLREPFPPWLRPAPGLLPL